MALHPVVAMYEETFRSGDPQAMLAYARIFAEAEFLLAGERLGGNGEVALMSIEPDGQPALLAAFDREAGASVLNIDPASFVPMPGNAVLALMRQQRVDLYVVGDADPDGRALVLANEVLLVLGQLLGIDEGRREPTVPAAASSAEVPREFSRWLYGYCARHPDIQRAHLSLVSLGDTPVPNVCVFLDALDAATHWPRIQARSDLLLPGQLLLDGTSETQAWAGQAKESVLEAAPLYCSTHGQGWWARLKRYMRPAPVVHVRMALRDE